MFEKAILFLMKNLLIISLMILVNQNIFSQNLVPNPSFEQYDTCPDDFDQIYLSTGWSSFGYSPDYFNSCSTPSSFGVPYNTFGFQNAVTGQAYVGLYSRYDGFPNVREFIGGQLTNPMLIGQKYYITLKVNLVLNNSYSNCATNKIGVLFSTVPYSISNPAPIANFAHIYSTAIISDTLNWTIISDSLIADSSYQYIVVGNFFDDSNTNTQLLGDTICQAYYYVDDICVSTDSSACNLTGISETEQENFLDIFPNPTSGFLFIKNRSTQYFSIALYNIVGKAILFHSIYDEGKNLFSVDLSLFPSGIYFLNFKTEKTNITHKIVLSK